MDAQSRECLVDTSLVAATRPPRPIETERRKESSKRPTHDLSTSIARDPFGLRVE
jgi:hypothetical protein